MEFHSYVQYIQLDNSQKPKQPSSMLVTINVKCTKVETIAMRQVAENHQLNTFFRCESLYHRNLCQPSIETNNDNQHPGNQNDKQFHMKSKSCVNLSFSVCSFIQHNSLILQFFLITFEQSSLVIAFSCNRHRHPEARKKDDQSKECIANKTTIYPVHKNLSNFTELNKEYIFAL